MHANSMDEYYRDRASSLQREVERLRRRVVCLEHENGELWSQLVSGSPN